jgi:hypothetical protein
MNTLDFNNDYDIDLDCAACYYAALINGVDGTCDLHNPTINEIMDQLD